MITTEIKQRVVAAIKERRSKFPNDTKMAIFLGINNAQYSRLVNKGELEMVISDANFISIARKLEISLSNNAELVTARTPVFEFIQSALQTCQQFGMSGLLCDIADIGKTYAARCYVREHKFAVYVDCSQVKSKARLIRHIAKELGINHDGRYNDVYADLVFYLNSIPTPLVILDEAGDLDYPAFLELKAMWNATERSCAWYMMGADGLKAKIERNLGRKKVGYAEIFRRFGNRFQKITPDGKESMDEFKKQQVSLIAKANGVNDLQKFYARTEGSLTRIYHEIQKLKSVA
jgi:hypothetical protein